MAPGPRKKGGRREIFTKRRGEASQTWAVKIVGRETGARQPKTKRTQEKCQGQVSGSMSSWHKGTGQAWFSTEIGGRHKAANNCLKAQTRARDKNHSHKAAPRNSASAESVLQRGHHSIQLPPRLRLHLSRR
jgi:hypothetical protein